MFSNPSPLLNYELSNCLSIPNCLLYSAISLANNYPTISTHTFSTTVLSSSPSPNSNLLRSQKATHRSPTSFTDFPVCHPTFLCLPSRCQNQSPQKPNGAGQPVVTLQLASFEDLASC